MNKFEKVLRNIIKYSPILIFIIFLTVFVISLCLEGTYNTNVDSQLNKYEDNWTVTIDDGETTKLEFPIAARGKNKVVLKKTLTNVHDEQLLIFRYCYADVVAKVDGEVIFTSSTPHIGGIKTYSGTNIFGINMKDKYENKEIEITLTHVPINIDVSIEHIYLNTPGDYFIYTIRTNFLQFVMCTIMIVASIFSLIVFAILKIKKVNLELLSANYFISFSIFTFALAVWVETDLNIYWALSGYQAANDIISLVAFMVFPIGITEIVYTIVKDYKKSFGILTCLFILNLVVQTILFLFCGVELHDMLVITQCLMGIALVASFTLMILSIIKSHSFEKTVLLCGFILFGILCLICIIGYFLGPVDFNYTIYFLSAMFVLAMDFFFILIKSFVKVISNQIIYAKTKEYAYKDQLTGLGNRRAYSEALSSVKHESVKNDYCIICFDVNYLKKTNDTLGHVAGDELLLAAANSINQIFANEKKDNTFRTGGDEFAAIVDLTQEELLERLTAFNVVTSNYRSDNIKTVSVAYGYASSSEFSELEPEELAIKADEMMYSRKRKMHKQAKK